MNQSLLMLFYVVIGYIVESMVQTFNVAMLLVLLSFLEVFIQSQWARFHVS